MALAKTWTNTFGSPAMHLFKIIGLALCTSCAATAAGAQA